MLNVDIYDYLRLPGIHARVSGVAAENIWARPNSRKQLSGKAEGGGGIGRTKSEKELIWEAKPALNEHQCLTHMGSSVNEPGMFSNLLGGLDKNFLQKLSQPTGVVLLVY
jgi:hypothetical protein